jgi:hypothetical protein
MHSYLVSLRINGDALNLKEISSELGIEPTQTRMKGQPRGGKSIWTDYMWEYEARPSKGKDWDSLEDALKAILSKFRARKKILSRYQRKFKVGLFCGHFSSSFDGGPTLSPLVLKQLGHFGVELFIDTYLSQGFAKSRSRRHAKPRR